jgi:diacylglycerol kinase
MHPSDPQTRKESPPMSLTVSTHEQTASRPRRSWRMKFAAAFRGIKLGVRGHSSFFVHFFFAALVLAGAVALQCRVWQWCVLLGCIGLVLTAELFNSALETLFRGLDESTKERTWPALDIAAGAVLLASLTASVIGCIVFITRLVEYLGGAGTP